MYFQQFPKTLYSLDDRKSLQLVTAIFIRVALSEEIKNNLSIYDEYDVRDGETPEIVADIFYGNPQLHWIVLHANEILDPRFEWPLSTENFRSHILSKYPSAEAIHHYENENGDVVNGTLFLNSSSMFSNLSTGNVIVNVTSTGTGVITSKQSSSNVTVMVSEGGFRAGDTIRDFNDNSVNTLTAANITATSSVSGTAVTVYQYEDKLNEQKRRIKIIKSQYIDTIMNNFKRLIEQSNG